MPPAMDIQINEVHDDYIGKAESGSRYSPGFYLRQNRRFSKIYQAAAGRQFINRMMRRPVANQ
jgi:hypothetical protein